MMEFQIYHRPVHLTAVNWKLSLVLSMFNDILINFRKDAFFVDLFVRMSNNVAVDMYKQLGYVIYRRVLEYYSGDPDEDAYGEKLLIIETQAPVVRKPIGANPGLNRPNRREKNYLSIKFYSSKLD